MTSNKKKIQFILFEGSRDWETNCRTTKISYPFFQGLFILLEQNPNYYYLAVIQGKKYIDWRRCLFIFFHPPTHTVGREREFVPRTFVLLSCDAEYYILLLADGCKQFARLILFSKHESSSSSRLPW